MATTEAITVEGHDKPTFQVRLEGTSIGSCGSIFPKQSLLAAVIEACRWHRGEHPSYKVVLRVPEAKLEAARKWASKIEADGYRAASAAATRKLRLARTASR